MKSAWLAGVGVGCLEAEEKRCLVVGAVVVHAHQGLSRRLSVPRASALESGGFEAQRRMDSATLRDRARCLVTRPSGGRRR